MPDLGPAAGALLEIGAPLVGRAFRAFAGSVLGGFVLAVLVAAGCWHVASERSATHGALAVVISLALFAVATVLVAGKRAVFAALIHAAGAARLGERAMALVFDRLVATETGVAAAQAAERLPLADAEAKLRRVVDALVREDAGGGFVRSRVRRALLERVELVTLAELRVQGAPTGGVELSRVRAALSGRIDGLVVGSLEGAALKITAALLGGATLVSLLAAFLARTLAR